MSRITSIQAKQILDSRGNPTVEVDVYTERGGFGRAAVPSGASTGVYEAVELRDGDPKVFLGKGVLKAVDNVNTIIGEELQGYEVLDQRGLDAHLIQLDATENKSNLGANAMLGVSLAAAKAAASEVGLPLYRYVGGVNATLLPIPMMNILNGGAHADNAIDIQEFMVMPINFTDFSSSLRAGVEVFHSLKKVLKAKKLTTNVGDEGGFAPNLSSNEEALELVLESIEKAGYKPGEDIFIALDAAASEFYDAKKKSYTLSGKSLTNKELVQYWESLVGKYPIVSIEDGFDQDDWEGWTMLSEKLGHKIQLVGDDLFVTNTDRLIEGLQKGAANSILVKVNQIGTLTETIEAVNLAHMNGFTSVMSHRSGETSDYTIADLAIALSTGQIKTGSASRSDRMAKYNQLLRIEQSLGSTGQFLGPAFRYV